MLSDEELCAAAGCNWCAKNNKPRGCSSLDDGRKMAKAQEEATIEEEHNKIRLWLNANTRNSSAMHKSSWKLRKGYMR